jgi:hypothetical protein
MNCIQAMQIREAKKACIDNIALCSTIRAVEIVANANQNHCLGYSTDYNFAELIRECSVINALHCWTIRQERTPKEKESDAEFYAGLPEEEKECYSFLIDDVNEPDQEINRFIEIMQTSPDMITSDMRKEAFKLAPHALRELELRGGF